MNTFKVFKRDSVNEFSATDTIMNVNRATSASESTANVIAEPFDSSPVSADQRNKVEVSLQDGAVSKKDQQCI